MGCLWHGFICKVSIRQLVNQLDIVLPNGKPYVAPSTVTQARKKLGHQAIEAILNHTQSLWHEKSAHPTWCGLTLLGVDGVDLSEIKLFVQLGDKINYTLDCMSASDEKLIDLPKSFEVRLVSKKINSKVCEILRQ